MAKSTRLNQNSFTGKIRPVVTIKSMTSNPVGTLFSVWYGSRHKDSVDPADIQYLYEADIDYTADNLSVAKLSKLANRICKDYPDLAGESGKDYKKVIKTVCKQCIESDVPAAESVNFVIEIDNANVAWREQLVRSKIASYWTQSTRTIDMTTMDINMADSVELIGGPKAVEIYNQTADVIRKAYVELEKLGVPIEDIRLQPQQHVHRVYWMISIRALVKILNKRSDWIAQASLWTPIIAGVCSYLRKLSLFDIIEDFIGKPPVKVAYHSDYEQYYVAEYIMNADNEDRYYGRDPLPCDGLWLAYKGLAMPEHTDLNFYDYLKSMYIQIWGDEYLKVLSWDRSDPSKLGRYDRPKSWFDSHGMSYMYAGLD